MVFSPASGDPPFTCGVRLKLHTGQYRFEAAKIGGNCATTTFDGLPWGVTLTGKNSGFTQDGGWGGVFGECSGGVQFTVSQSGVWTFPPGGCIAGTLTSDPPVTITK